MLPGVQVTFGSLAAVGAPPELLLYDEIGFFGVRAAETMTMDSGMAGSFRKRGSGRSRRAPPARHA